MSNLFPKDVWYILCQDKNVEEAAHLPDLFTCWKKMGFICSHRNQSANIANCYLHVLENSHHHKVSQLIRNLLDYGCDVDKKGGRLVTE